MSKNNIFKELDVSNKVSRNGFNLSSMTRFTAKCGELLPVYHKSVLPGDKFRMSVNSFTRTAPVQTAAFTKFKEYFDWFFVPYRILGKQIPQILAKNIKNPSIASSSTSNQPVASSLPKISLNELFGIDPLGPRYLYTLGNFENEFGFNRGMLSGKLLNHLGYGFIDDDNLAILTAGDGSFDGYVLPYVKNLEVTILPLLAYQKIYYDFYRNSQWEDNVPYNYNVDYMGTNMHFYVQSVLSGGSFNPYYNNPTLFDLRYANYPKDLFMGLLPNSQYGDESVMELDIPDSVSSDFVPLETENGERVIVGNGNVDGEETQHTVTGINDSDITYHSQMGFHIRQQLKNMNASISVLEERKARVLQKYKEILGSGSLDYQTIIRKIFNVDVPDTLADHCIYLGGSSFVVNISEVENTNLNDDPKSAIQRGKGIGSGNGDMVDFESDEYGIIMCIYHCAPIVDYALNAMHFDVVKTEADDYANPVFDNLGFVEFPTYFLSNARITVEGAIPSDFLGYTTRYFDCKTSVDMTLGDFRNTLKDWIAPLGDEYLINRPDEYVTELDYTFFKINPHIVDRIFGVDANSRVNTDTFRISATFNVSAVRNLNYLGVPF